MVTSTSTHPAGFDGTPATNARRTLSRHRLWLLVMSMLGCSLLLQLVAMTAPGWYIYGTYSKYGLFYVMFCTHKGTCIVKSFWDQYMDAIKDAPESNIPFIRREFSHNKAYQQTGAILAFACTLASILALLCCRNAKTKSLIYTSYVLTPILSVTGFIMGEMLYCAFVKLDFLVKLIVKADPGKKVGFPYCVLCYSIACIQVFVSVFGMSKFFHDRITDIDQEIHASDDN